MGTRKVFLAVLVLAGVAIFASGAEAQRTPGNLTPGAAGIQNTKHNLSNAANFINTQDAAANKEICVFCHTPHGADTTVAAPLWNRKINSGTYTVYSSPSFDASPTNDGKAPQPNGVSLACLSCHDGTIAFDALRNLPGSGGYDPTATSAGWVFNNGNNIMPTGRITNLGDPQVGGQPDLSNDHPISMCYADAKSPSSLSGTNDHATGFYEPTGGSACSDVVDKYFANGLKIAAGKVQCSSCHDPHRSDNVTFLRIDNGGKGNEGSAICLTCHKKNG